VIVVSDTSPLNYLVIIGAIDVLPKLFGEIHLPTQVLVELTRSKAPVHVKQWASSPPQWLRVSTPSITIPSLDRLGLGEAQAIALATELNANIILIDERKGRRIAAALGFDAVGTLTVLEFAAERKLLDLAAVLKTLRATTFYITDSYIDAALERDAARKLTE
jgi:predicted nucleic acid-binding protein